MVTEGRRNKPHSALNIGTHASSEFSSFLKNKRFEYSVTVTVERMGHACGSEMLHY